MKNWLPELIGTAGFCLFVSGLYVQFGPGWALMAGGALLLAAAIKAVRQ
ncbi:hypothetical protein [Pseudomonas simiae]|jgi:hypothetical protein|uniref:Uncharacterized protein n=1 Tax=Pseudomonas simiae TaxID=321846 RepID=U1TED6_9PSED|nr:hypothetical protein [Pseudomonas simiae]ERH56529.1 hypothetical protein O204_05535 [Pseudomonas simiae]